MLKKAQWNSISDRREVLLIDNMTIHLMDSNQTLHYLKLSTSGNAPKEKLRYKKQTNKLLIRTC